MRFRKYETVMPYRLEDAEYAIVGSGCMIETAEAAVERVQDETRVRITRTNDSYLRERLHDFEDLARRLALRQRAAPDVQAEGVGTPVQVVLEEMVDRVLVGFGAA